MPESEGVFKHLLEYCSNLKSKSAPRQLATEPGESIKNSVFNAEQSKVQSSLCSTVIPVMENSVERVDITDYRKFDEFKST